MTDNNHGLMRLLAVAHSLKTGLNCMPLFIALDILKCLDIHKIGYLLKEKRLTVLEHLLLFFLNFSWSFSNYLYT